LTNNKNSNILEIRKKIKLSDKFKKAVAEEFENMTCRLELIINSGGIQNAKIEFNNIHK